MHQIETGTLSPDGKHDCVFLWLYCRDGRPYTKYRPAGADEAMPMVFALLRWDGTFGTMGGKVDPGESLHVALSREACEEANFWLPENAEIEQLGTFQDGPWHIHSFCYELTYGELVSVRGHASAQAYAHPEVAGFVIAPAGEYMPGANGAPRGVGAFSHNQFCSTAKLELDLLLHKLSQPS